MGSSLITEIMGNRGGPHSSESIIRATKHHFGEGLAMTSHGGLDSAFAIHQITRIIPRIRVLYIRDEATQEFMEDLKKKLFLNVLMREPAGDKLADLVTFCRDLGVTAMIHGVRRYQTEVRANKSEVELGTDGLYRIHPFLEWSQTEVTKYLRHHQLPFHPTLSRNAKKDECGIHCFTKK